MANDLIVRRTKDLAALNERRAAQYVRMSTDYQRYSIENQAAVIATYAQVHGLKIVRTYRDEGQSGLRLKNRAGLIQLLSDVESGHADFRHILVYDVSRWGRFQDTDESAHYEFLCKKAGLKVAYCAEQFDNDGTMMASILKNLKRVMAAEYSRDLSVKIHAGAMRLSRLGFRTTGEVGYGLRRQLVDEKQQSKAIMQKGDRKYLITDRVKVVPGPPHEVAHVRWIFQQFVEGKYEDQIARELNKGRISTKTGRPWNGRMIGRMLRNECYVGNLIYKLQESGKRTAIVDACLTIDGRANVSFRVARWLHDGHAGHAPHWTVQRKRLVSGWVVAIRLGARNNALLDYLLFPASLVTMPTLRFTEKRRLKLGISQFASVSTLSRSIIRRLSSAKARAAQGVESLR